MDNLTQSQTNSNQNLLDEKRANTINLYLNAGADERRAVLRNIDSFLPTVAEAEKIFWLKFRRELEQIAEAEAMQAASFVLGDFTVVPMPLSHKGGIVSVFGKLLLFVNSSLSEADRAEVIEKGIAEFNAGKMNFQPLQIKH